MDSKAKQILLGYLFALLSTAIWSGNFVVARGLSESIPPVTIAFWRWVVAFLISSPFALKYLIKDWKVLKKHFLYLLLTSIFGVTIFNTLIYIAGHTTTALNLSLISITFPIFILIFSRILYKESIRLKNIAGIILVVFGVILILTKGNLNVLLELTFYVGDLWMILAAIIFALYSILLKRKPKELSILGFQYATFILGLILLFPFYLWEYLSVPEVVFTKESIFSILYIGIFASLVAFVLWNKSISIIGPANAGMIYYTLPLFSGLLAFLILDESIHVIHIYSAVCIISGIIISNRKSKKELVR